MVSQRAHGWEAALLGRCAFPSAGEHLSCAVSGGADSMALVRLATLAGCEVTAIHVDHGLRDGSAAEAELVAEAAAKVGAAFRAERVEVAPGPNLEARARQARLAVLPEDVATGHTADDQAETVLLNLMRGSALDGIAGMRAGRRHPLLALRRRETSDVCRRAGLAVLEDPSNRDPRYLRNRVRHELIPMLSVMADRDVALVLARQAGLLAEESAFIDALASAVDPTDAASLAGAPVVLARRAVRLWVRGSGPYPPSSAAIERVLAVARKEARSCEVEGGVRVTRSRGRLRLERPRSGSCAGGPDGH